MGFFLKKSEDDKNIIYTLQSGNIFFYGLIFFIVIVYMVMNDTFGIKSKDWLVFLIAVVISTPFGIEMFPIHRAQMQRRTVTTERKGALKYVYTIPKITQSIQDGKKEYDMVLKRKGFLLDKFEDERQIYYKTNPKRAAGFMIMVVVIAIFGATGSMGFSQYNWLTYAFACLISIVIAVEYWPISRNMTWFSAVIKNRKPVTIQYNSFPKTTYIIPK